MVVYHPTLRQTSHCRLRWRETGNDACSAAAHWTWNRAYVHLACLVIDQIPVWATRRFFLGWMCPAGFSLSLTSGLLLVLRTEVKESDSLCNSYFHTCCTAVWGFVQESLREKQYSSPWLQFIFWSVLFLLPLSFLSPSPCKSLHYFVLFLLCFVICSRLFLFFFLFSPHI